MKLDTHWLIKSVGHTPSEKSVVKTTEDIVALAKLMRDHDVIYTYHTDKPLDRIALYGTDEEKIVVSIQGCGGGFDKTYAIGELKTVLDNFEETQLRCEELGFKPDWE